MSITDFILGGEKSPTKKVEASSTLTDTILSTPQAETPKVVEKFSLEKEAASQRARFVKGMTDVIDAVASGIGFIDKTLVPGGEKRNEVFQKRLKEENKKFDEANPPDGFDPSRTLGQVVVTAPLTPVKAFQAVKGAMGAIPIAGQSAPFLNKAAASAVTGGLAGAEFGALTSTSNDKSLLENTGEGAIAGVVAGPILTGAGEAGKKAYQGVKNLWANIQISKVARNSNMEPIAIKNAIEIIQNAGYTPQQAQAALVRMGPQATLSDLAQSIQTEASGIASLGGKPTEILKGRYEARAKTANSEAKNIMETKLGPKPDIEAEKTKIVEDARKAVAPDYEAGKKVNGLDIHSVIDKINSELEAAVGEKAQALKLVKSYLHKNEKDASGNVVSVLKHNAKELHEVRMAIDSILEGKNPKTSYGRYAKSVLEDVRAGIDKELKTIPEYAAADAKFAKEMDKVKLIDAGYDVLENGMNKEEFARFYGSLSPNQQALVQKGMRANIGDRMEKATRGELSEAQRLFGKGSLNRDNMEKVFGNVGTDVLDALEKQAMFRGTEQKVMHGAQTAERQSVQRKYGERTDGGSKALDLVKAGIIDLATGSPATATAITTTRRAGSSVMMNIGEGKKARLTEGTADILSRSGTDRDTALSVARTVDTIQNRIKPKVNLRLPKKNAAYILSSPTGQLGYSEYKRLNQE